MREASQVNDAFDRGSRTSRSKGSQQRSKVLLLEPAPAPCLSEVCLPDSDRWSVGHLTRPLACALPKPSGGLGPPEGHAFVSRGAPMIQASNNFELPYRWSCRVGTAAGSRSCLQFIRRSHRARIRQRTASVAGGGLPVGKRRRPVSGPPMANREWFFRYFDWATAVAGIPCTVNLYRVVVADGGIGMPFAEPVSYLIEM